MKKRGWVSVLLISMVFFISSVHPDFAHGARKMVSIASGWVVGVYFPLAGAISRIAHEKLPDIKITVESSGASVANAKLIGTGDADLAILQNDIAFYAYRGTKPMFERAISNMRGVATLYPEHCQIQARRAANIQSPKDLTGKRVAVGPLGSGTEQNAMQILEAYGLTFADLAKVERLTAAESSDYLKDGRIDAAFYTVGVGASALVDTAMMSFFSKAKVPKGSYKGVDQDIPTIAVLAMIVAKAELEDDVVYKITKAMFENLKDIERAHAKGKEVKLETAIVGIPIPLHPGAERFYKEKGLK